MEDQKNLRRQYQQVQSGLQQFIADNVISGNQNAEKLSDGMKLKKHLKRMQRKSQHEAAQVRYARYSLIALTFSLLEGRRIYWCYVQSTAKGTFFFFFFCLFFFAFVLVFYS